MTIRVLVAEDQAAVRAGLVLILSSAPDIEVVGEAGTARRRCGWRANSGRIWS